MDLYDSRNNKNISDLSSFIFGKVPPQASAIEEAVLGALMIDKDSILPVSDLLQKEAFYSDAHQNIYEAILSLYRESKPIDLLTVQEKLKSMGCIESIGGAYYLVELTNRVASSSNIEYHARIILQKYIQRELIRMSNEITIEAYKDETDVFDLLDKAEQLMYAVVSKMNTKRVTSMSEATREVLKAMEASIKTGVKHTGVTTGFFELDKLTSGWQRSDLIILAARPSMGKTLLAIKLAINAAKENIPVAFFSLEMSTEQLTERILSSESNIEANRIKNVNLTQRDWQDLQEAAEKTSKLPLYFDDSPGVSIYELRSKVRKLKLQYGIQLVVVDYLQLMTTGNDSKFGNNREQEISKISRGLKGLAKELNIPVIALSQLSRAVEMRGGNKKPQLSDLRESGAIEQDADLVGFIYRPEYYQIVETDSGHSTRGLMEIIISKHRNGSLGDVSLHYKPEVQNLTDWDDYSMKVETQKLEQNIITRPHVLNDDNKDIPF